MSAFIAARNAFGLLAAALRDDNDIREDVKKAFELLLSRYNTRIYENRFIVGGVAERIVAATFLALGHEAEKAGVVVTRTDLSVAGCNFSVKGAFRPVIREFRLINTMGDSAEAVWNEPTIFVVSAVGIGYADPGLIPNSTTRKKDVLTIKSSLVYQFWNQHPEYLVSMNLPCSRDDADGSDIASRIVADEILRYTKRLRPFDPRTSKE